MGDTERPIPERDGDQEAQAQQLVQTGNGPTVDDEQQLLADQHGNPDMAGVYVGPGPAGDAEAGDDTTGPAVEGEPAAPDTAAPAADGTAEGGETA